MAQPVTSCKPCQALNCAPWQSSTLPRHRCRWRSLMLPHRALERTGIAQRTIQLLRWPPHTWGQTWSMLRACCRTPPRRGAQARSAAGRASSAGGASRPVPGAPASCRSWQVMRLRRSTRVGTHRATFGWHVRRCAGAGGSGGARTRQMAASRLWTLRSSRAAGPGTARASTPAPRCVPA